MDLIGREALIEEIKCYQMDIVSKATAMKVIRNAPSVEAVPVVHGSWLKFGSWAVCNKCNHIMEYNRKSNFCPECGADMRKKV